jgi:hypothetical protein
MAGLGPDRAEAVLFRRVLQNNLIAKNEFACFWVVKFGNGLENAKNEHGAEAGRGRGGPALRLALGV